MHAECNFIPVRAVETRVLRAAFCVKFPVELCILFTALFCVEGILGFIRINLLSHCKCCWWCPGVLSRPLFFTFLCHSRSSSVHLACKCYCLVVIINTSNVMGFFRELIKNHCSVGLRHCLKTSNASTGSLPSVTCSKNVYK